MRRFAILMVLAMLAWGCAAQRPVETAAAPSDVTAPSTHQWFKGNVHTHTNKSDGDSTPILVVRWYRDHGYDFLALTDHGYQNPIEDLQNEIAEEGAKVNTKPLLLIPGEENGAKVKTPDRPRAVHVLALGASQTVGIQTGDNVPDGIQKCVDAIRTDGGLPVVNHPNFMWTLTADDLYGARDVNLFEVANAHPGVNNLGGGGNPSTEEIWDNLLSRGRLYYGVGDDDAHAFQKWSLDYANPGRAWLMVRADELTAPAILEAIRRGDFYVSTGVTLDELTMENGTLRLAIHKRGDSLFRTEFIGKGGKVLATDETMTPSYHLKRGDMYVRARVTSSRGHRAWTQPLFAHGVAGQ